MPGGDDLVDEVLLGDLLGRGQHHVPTSRVGQPLPDGPGWPAPGPRQHDNPDEHTSGSISCNPSGDEILGLAVRLFQYTAGRHPMTDPAVMLTITEDGQSEGHPLTLGQARVLAHALRRLDARQRREEGSR